MVVVQSYDCTYVFYDQTLGFFLIFNREDLFKMLTLFQCHSWTRQPKNKDIALFFHTNLYNLIER